jgi:D-citramalate synthase
MITSIANVMEALKAGVHGLHVTVNGMGNALETPLESTVAVINDFMPEIEISVKNLHCTPLVNWLNYGLSHSTNKPIVGDNVFYNFQRGKQ